MRTGTGLGMGSPWGRTATVLTERHQGGGAKGVHRLGVVWAPFVQRFIGRNKRGAASALRRELGAGTEQCARQRSRGHIGKTAARDVVSEGKVMTAPTE